MKSFCGWGFGGYNMTTGGEGTGGINLYNESQVSKAKELIKTGLNYDDITKEVGISPGHLSNINLGKYYYDKNETYPLRKNYYSKDEIQEIIELLKNSDLSMKEIAEEKGRGYATIKKINYGMLWHDENLNYPIRKESP